MGSGQLLKAKPQITMADEKKSFVNPFKNVFKWLKKAKGKETKEPKNDKTVKSEEKIVQTPKVTSVAELLEKLELEKKKERDGSEEEDEMNNFIYKVIEDDVPKTHSIDSQRSVDSGFTEKTTEDDTEANDLVKKLEDLSVDTEKKDVEDEKKKKKLCTVFVSRGPIKSDSSNVKIHPYAAHHNDGYRQVQHTNLRQVQSQINKQTLSGGHVIVNETKAENLALAQAVNVVDQSVEKFSKRSKDEQDFFLSVATEFLNENNVNQVNVPLHYQETNPSMFTMNEDLEPLTLFNTENPTSLSQQAPVDYNMYYSCPSGYDTTLAQLNYSNDDSHQNLEQSFIFPTPPRSENIPSPMSDSLFLPGSDCTFSPGTSSPMGNSDFEQYQPLGDYVVPDILEEEAPKVDKKKEKPTNNLKYYKDLQKEIANKFSKKECCQLKRRSCKEIFQEHIQKLPKDERTNVLIKVAKMDLENAFDVLRYIIIQLSKNQDDEDRQLAIFSLICEKVLGQQPELFIEDFGLNLIKLAVLCCYSRPLLTRYLVQCSRISLKIKGKILGDSIHVFHELDAQGDNVLHACVRQGDICADVLSELVRKEADELPLFDVHHSNSDGFMPLHLACKLHSAEAPRHHVTHVLLEHAGADLWKWDIKGGDSALHLAVNSATCELNLIMILFRHVERKEWKRLAHYRNRGSASVVEMARAAARSAARARYPPAVYEFLLKCR